MVCIHHWDSALLGSAHKPHGNRPSKRMNVNHRRTFFVKDIDECEGGLGIPAPVKLSEHIIAFGRRPEAVHAQIAILIDLIAAVRRRRRNKRFDPMSSQATSQGFDIDLRSASWVGRKREWDM